VAAYNTIHSRYILHGDVQPRHVLLHTDGKIRIIDWEGATACDEGFAEPDASAFREEICRLYRMLGRVASRLTLTFPEPCDWS
jgi:RIO-like serine/threonine protein kinase